MKYSERLDTMFRALGDSSRRAMIERLVRSPASVTELGRPFPMSMPAVVQHLAVLTEAGIVTSEKVGRVRTYQLTPDALAEVGAWVAKQRRPAEQQLDRLDRLLRDPDGADRHPPHR